MSETSYTALQGKVCVVTLKGTAGTNYQWCLTSMPKELALFGTDSVPETVGMFGGTYQEHFYFLVKGGKEITVSLKFELICISDPTEVAKTTTVKIRIIPADSSDFASLDTVAQVQNVDTDAWVTYGYVCDMQDNQQIVEYGYSCGVQDSVPILKYGYPCGVQDSVPALKYGYPCGVQDSVPTLKYGYPCGMRDSLPMLKYGYLCGRQDLQPTPKYGYPCSMQDR